VAALADRDGQSPAAALSPTTPPFTPPEVYTPLAVELIIRPRNARPRVIQAQQKEHFRVVMLNTKNELLGIDTVTIGCVDSASVRIAEVFREPIRKQASSIILAHNHPTGHVTASPDDVLLTRQIIQAGQIMEIAVLDHLVIGQGRWASLREQRLGWQHRCGAVDGPELSWVDRPAASLPMCPRMSAHLRRLSMLDYPAAVAEKPSDVRLADGAASFLCCLRTSHTLANLLRRSL
jgi:hypothetical protein